MLFIGFLLANCDFFWNTLHFTEWGNKFWNSSMTIFDFLQSASCLFIEEAKNPQIGTSLAVFKPQRIVDFVWEESSREWNKQKLDAVYANQAQQSLFDVEETKRIFKVAKKLPYEFSYKFISEDGKERKLMIEDWELGMLYWNCLAAANGNEQVACEKVKQKYFTEWCKKDIYFFLGTTKKFHNVGTNPFIIIGTFYPPKNPQLTLTFKMD